MKKDDIYNGVTDVDESHVTGAKSKRTKKRALIAGIAAALAVAVGVGGFLVWRNGREGTFNPGKLDTPTAKKLAIAQAEYPERVKYPYLDGDRWEYDEDQWNKWWEDSRKKALNGEELETMNDAYAALLPALIGAAEGKDAACSPANVYIALSMLAETTANESRQQLLDLLGTDSVEAQRQLTKRLWNALYNDDGTYSSLLANSVWLRGDTQYEKAALETLARDYYASSFAGQMGSDAFNGLLRDWMNGQTGGLLKDQINNISLDPETALALVSTAYFADRWEYKFTSDRTDKQVFHGESGDYERDFMHKVCGESRYYWADKFAGVILNFESGGSMRFLLPDEGVSIEEVLADPMAIAFLTESAMRETFKDNSKTMDIFLSLPKFDVTSDLKLMDTLISLGVTDVFDPAAADFSAILKGSALNDEPLYVSQVLHGARVKVDEEGCEAAAYTLIPMVGAAAPQEVDQIDLVFDRPFLYSLMSQGVPMFAGCVRE